ncbi:MAG: citrate/2-methylcitrate synthase [Spirochaetaceae bacterium]|nr:citrate/2-methylcitrate synthase [Spirochaetaceae bacterium]
MKTFNNDDLKKYSTLAQQNNVIEPSRFNNYDVKRGLRNSDGTGVLVGLTKIGDVHGYILDENEKIPVEGRLRYRGIDIRDLTEGFLKEGRFGFEETIYLLLFGELPAKLELEKFTKILSDHRKLPKGFTEDMILKAPSSNIMNKLARSVLAAYSYDENPEDLSVYNCLRQSIQLISWFPVLVSYAYQAKEHYYNNKTLTIHTPDPSLSTSENLLMLIRSNKKYTVVEAELLDLCMVLHAEHGGGNNSTFSIHLISSAATDTYSAVAAAIGSLKGAKHGGANIKVIAMLDNVKKNVKNWKDKDEVSAYLEKIINKEAFDKTGLIYGMGHAVYTYSDPRAVILKTKARKLAKLKGMEDEFDLLNLIEELTPKVFLKVKGSSKVISANVDFYSGFVYRMLDIPEDLFTPIFAIARIAGWSAHRIEEGINGRRIMRPAYKHIKIPGKEFTALNER